MRLTCPRCAAQYEIADSAIPPAGREVECSTCSHVWHQPGPEKPASPVPAESLTFNAEARPALNRVLDESVLSILREEAARELRARADETSLDAADHIPATEPPAESVPEPAEPGTPEPETAKPVPVDWPATTLTGPGASLDTTPPDTTLSDAVLSDEPEDAAPEAEPPAEPSEAELRPDQPAPMIPILPDAAELAATLTRPGPPLPRTEPAEDAGRATLRPAQPDAPAAAPARRPEAPVPAIVPPPPRRSGYGAGFGLAAMLALGVVALYALAPQIPADRGGATLAEWRQGIDRGRLWLHDRILGE